MPLTKELVKLTEEVKGLYEKKNKFKVNGCLADLEIVSLLGRAVRDIKKLKDKEEK